jgi:hypothetical protein
MTRVIDDSGKAIDVALTSTVPNDSITNLKLAKMSGLRLKGNASSSLANPQDLDQTAVRTFLGLLGLAYKATVGTADIDNDAVTFAKMQNVSGPGKLWGRKTTSSGAGDAEELAGSDVRSVLGTLDADTLGTLSASTIATNGANAAINTRRSTTDMTMNDTPTNPASGDIRLVVGTDHVLRWRDSAGTMYAASDATTAAALQDHLDEVDPIVHSASKIYSAASVGSGTVEGDLNALNSVKADASAVATADALKVNVADAIDVSSSVTSVNQNNITINTDVNMFSFTLPANTLSTNGDMLIIDAEGDMLANSGTPTFTWKIKNGTVVLSTPAVSPAVSANQRRWILRVRIRRTSSVAAQSIAAKLLISQATATTQWNLFDTGLCFAGHLLDSAATDFASAMTISFTVAMSVQNANNRFRMYAYEAYKVRVA